MGKGRLTAPDLGRVRWSFGFIGLLVYIASVTTFRINLAVPAMAIAIFAPVVQGDRPRVPVFVWLLALLVAWGGIGYPISMAPVETAEILTTMMKLIVVAIAIATILSDVSRLRVFLIFFLFCVMLYPVRGALTNYVLGYRLFGRAIWNVTFANPNDLAAFLFFPLGVAMWLVLTDRRVVRLGALAAVPAILVLILLTQSRGALIALVASGLFFLITQAKGRRLRGFLVVAALGMCTLPLVPESAWGRFSKMRSLASSETISDADPEGSAEGRYNIWRVAFRIIRENPATGVGWGAYQIAHRAYAADMDVPPQSKGLRDTHSTYWNVAAELGVPGLALFLLMIAKVVIDAVKARRRSTNASIRELIRCLITALIGFLVAGLFASEAKLNTLYLQLALISVATSLANVSGATAMRTRVLR